jgi:hypothetical protein
LFLRAFIPTVTPWRDYKIQKTSPEKRGIITKKGLLLSYLSKQNNFVLQDLAPIPYGTVAGRHRASPSATLDKRTYYSFTLLKY